MTTSAEDYAIEPDAPPPVADDHQADGQHYPERRKRTRTKVAE